MNMPSRALKKPESPASVQHDMNAGTASKDKIRRWNFIQASFYVVDDAKVRCDGTANKYLDIQ